MNLTQADEKVIKLINFYSIAGVVISSTDSNYLDYSNRFRVHYDTCQKEIAKTAKRIISVKNISQNPIPSQLCTDETCFDIVQHLDTDITYSATGSRAYCFKVDNVATVYIEEETSTDVWGLLSQIDHATPTGEFTEYKGLINPSDVENNIRIRFGGLYVYNLRDVALFAYTFPTSAAIPQYNKYNLYTMPATFHKLIDIKLKGVPLEGDSRINPVYYWEKRNVLAVNYFYKGEFEIKYAALPTTIDDTTVTTTAFEIDEDAHEAIPFYVAAMMMMTENPSAFNKLFTIYQGMIGNLDDTIKEGTPSVVNTLFRSGAGNYNFRR